MFRLSDRLGPNANLSPGGGTPPGLGTNTDKPASWGLTPETQSRYRARYRLLMAYAYLLWSKGIEGHRLTYCRRYPGVGWRYIGVQAGENSRYQGVAVCGRGSYCPVCAAPIQAARGQRISEALAGEIEAGHAVMFLTLTVPHTSKTQLEESLDAVMKSFSAIVQGSTRDLRRAKQDIGWRNYVRTLEVNYGKNGYHPHLHIAVTLEKVPEKAVLDRYREALTAAWQHEVVKRGLKKPSQQHGVDVRMWTGNPTDMASYLAKAVGAELTGGEFKTKQQPHSTLSMWGVMAAATQGHDWAFRAYEHYIEITRGRRFISASKGFLRPLTEQDEQEIAEAEARKAEFEVPDFFIEPSEWSNSDLRDLGVTTLDLARRAGPEAAREFLMEEGITTYPGPDTGDFRREKEMPERGKGGRFISDSDPPTEVAEGGVGNE